MPGACISMGYMVPWLLTRRSLVFFWEPNLQLNPAGGFSLCLFCVYSCNVHYFSCMRTVVYHLSTSEGGRRNIIEEAWHRSKLTFRTGGYSEWKHLPGKRNDICQLPYRSIISEHRSRMEQSRQCASMGKGVIMTLWRKLFPSVYSWCYLCNMNVSCYVYTSLCIV